MSTPYQNYPAMSGNFDFPPASRPPTVPPRVTRHLLHQRIRELDNLRAQHEQGREDRSRTPPQHRPEYSSRARPSPPPMPAGVRRHTNSSRFRFRSSTVADPTSTLMDRLHSATSEADSLLDQPIPRIGSPDISTREYSGEAEVNRRRKRRKVDHEECPVGVGMNGFRYGHRGSVAPGPLRMEIVACDGGLHAEAARVGREYLPENVLRNDRSVYCTNNSRCNLIFRHKDEVTFTLSKIVIKAPSTGFTAPIQEGLIFVSMTSTNLLSRTASYTMCSSSPSASSQTGLDENHRPLSRRRDSTSGPRAIPAPISDNPYSTTIPHFDHNFPGAYTGPHDHSFPTPYTGPLASQVSSLTTTTQPAPLASQVSSLTTTTQPPPLVPDFHITTNCDTPSSDEEEPSSAATLADRQRRDQAPPPYTDSESEDMDENIERAIEVRALGISPRVHRGEMRTARSRRRAEPSRIECRVFSSEEGKAQPSTAEGGASQEEQKPNVLAPHARFFIEREKSVVSVKFEPPVTGKFILVKLWSPSRDQNIDIQSIIAHGFAGPRYFPSTKIL